MKNTIVIFMCTMSFLSCTSISTAELICKNSHNAVYYYLPIKVNGQKLTFLIDTGTQYTIIDYTVAKKMGIVSIDSSFHTIYGPTYTHEDTVYWGLVDLQIGDIKLKNKTALDRYKRPIFRDFSIYKNCDGILGVDIISKFNWLFDFKNKTVCLSNKAIDNPSMAKEPALSLDIVRSKKDVTYVELLLNNTLKEKFLFDTGNYNAVKMGDYNLHGAFCFSDTLRNLLAKRFPNNLTISATDTTSVLLMEKLQVNEMKFSYISAVHNNNLLSPNVITAQLLPRFHLMYYDKINKKINFYLSQSDTNVERGEEIRLLHTKIVNKLLNNKGGETTCSWNELFTKHDSANVKIPVK